MPQGGAPEVAEVAGEWFDDPHLNATGGLLDVTLPDGERLVFPDPAPRARRAESFLNLHGRCCEQVSEARWVGSPSGPRALDDNGLA